MYLKMLIKSSKDTNISGCGGKKTALLQPDFFIGFANVLFCAVACLFEIPPKTSIIRRIKI